MYVCAKSLQLCLALCDLMDCNLPGSSAHGIPQARILEWVAISSPRASSQSRDQTCISPLQPCYQHHLPNGTFFFFFYQRKMFIIIITQSQWFTLCFTSGFGYSLYNRYNSLQFLTEYFHCPQIFCAFLPCY